MRNAPAKRTRMRMRRSRVAEGEECLQREWELEADEGQFWEFKAVGFVGFLRGLEGEEWVVEEEAEVVTGAMVMVEKRR